MRKTVVSAIVSALVCLALPVIAEPSKPMAVDDLILDADTLKGKSVDVRGFVACIGNNGTCMLYDDPSSFTKNVMFSAANLPREDRARLNECNLLSGCKVTVSARVVNRPLEALDVKGMNWGDGMHDATARQQPVAPANNSPLSVKDFILDSGAMKGRTVTVRGSAWCESGVSCVLMERGWMQQQAAQFNAAALSRENRRKLLDCLEGINPGCPADVTGTVLRDGYLDASGIAWR